MKIVYTKSELYSSIENLRSKNKGKCVFIPTMGALHDGHLSLIKLANIDDIVVCSIFVNPRQFGVDEDFDRYPRVNDDDFKKLNNVNCDIVYVPTIDEVYCDNQLFNYKARSVDDLENQFRPHFLDGVCDVVSRLFEHVMADIAIFGQKDYQQLLTIKNMVQDLSLPIEIIAAPIIREKNDLAMSSRNKYLSDDEIKIAPLLYKTLCDAKEKLINNQLIENYKNDKGSKGSKKIADIVDIEKYYSKFLLDNGFDKVDYFAIRCKKTLQKIKLYQEDNSIILVAAYLGDTRLIDNL